MVYWHDVYGDMLMAEFKCPSKSKMEQRACCFGFHGNQFNELQGYMNVI